MRVTYKEQSTKDCAHRAFKPCLRGSQSYTYHTKVSCLLPTYNNELRYGMDRVQPLTHSVLLWRHPRPNWGMVHSSMPPKGTAPDQTAVFIYDGNRVIGDKPTKRMHTKGRADSTACRTKTIRPRDAARPRTLTARLTISLWKRLQSSSFTHAAASSDCLDKRYSTSS